MFPSLECKIRLKTNTYLPEIPNSWLNSNYLPKFDENTNSLICEKIPSVNEINGSKELENGPFISACYSENGEIMAISNLDGIFLLGSYTRTCFAAIPFKHIKSLLNIEHENLVCNELYIFGYNQFLITLFDDFISFWDILFYKNDNNFCYLPKYLGSLKIHQVFEFINEISNNQFKQKYSEIFNLEEIRKDKFISIQGIRIKKNEKNHEERSNNQYFDLVIEFNVEFSKFLPLLVQVVIINNNKKNEFNNYILKIHKIYDVLPDQILNLLLSNNENNMDKKIVSFTVFNNIFLNNLYSDLYKIYFVFVHIYEKNYIYLFDNNKNILAIEIISNYNKKQFKYLNCCKMILNNNGDLLIIQYSDKFSIYSIVLNNFVEDNHISDNNYSLENNKNISLKLKLKLLYTYTQVIQKEWITSISVFKDKREYPYDLNFVNEFYTPITQIYPCGILAVTTISSNGLSFYYLMKICSLSDMKSYQVNRETFICDHNSDDKTGSNMILWKIELTRLNGIRKVLWQPGESTCLAIQFIEKIKNSKLLYDDFFELINTNKSNISDLDKNSNLGNIFFIESSYKNDDMLLWSRLMTDFTAIHKNKEYVESEDEFDNQNDHYFRLKKYKPSKNFYINYKNLLFYCSTSININSFSQDVENYNKNLNNIFWITNDKKIKEKYHIIINYNKY